MLGALGVHAASCTGWQRFAGGEIAFCGKYGVQLFFMVSAFTIFLTLDRARWEGWWTCQEFFIRRFFRILPMFWFALALYAFVPGRESNAKFAPLDYVLTAGLQQGWLPGVGGVLVPGGWSIAVEATFYLVAPLCFRAIRTWQAALWLLLGSLVGAEVTNALVVALYNGGSLLAGEPRQMVGTWLYCWFPTQSPVFACGILAYHLTRQMERRLWTRGTGALLLAAAALWTFACVDIGKHGVLHEHVFFALGFLPLILGLKVWPAGLLVNPVTRFLGKVSYSAYLLHFVVLEAAFNSLVTFLEPEWQDSLLAFALLSIFTLLGTVPLAWLTHRYVERPSIDLGARFICFRRRAAADRATAKIPEMVTAAGY